MRTVTVPATDGFPLAVQTTGQDDAPALLLLQGQANSHRWWTGLREAFGEHFRVVTLRLVLACTSPGGPQALERGPDVRRRLTDPKPARRRQVLHRHFYSDAWPHGPGDSHLLGDPTMTAEESRAHLRASARHDAWALLPHITAPTLVLHGTDDLMVPAGNAGLIAARIPDATAHLHPGGRHGFFDEHAALVLPLIRDFLQRRPRSASSVS